MGEREGGEEGKDHSHWPVPHVQIAQSASGMASSAYCTFQQHNYNIICTLRRYM